MPAIAFPDWVLDADPIAGAGLAYHLHLTIFVFDYDEAVA